MDLNTMRTIVDHGGRSSTTQSTFTRSTQHKVVKVYYLNAENSLIDVLTERIRDSKNEIDGKNLEPLDREDTKGSGMVLDQELHPH